MATRRKRRDDESRRISKLPKPILHHILSFLPQKEAIRTCVLSKTWRHLGPTRPNVDLRLSDFSCGNRKKLLSALDKTLQTYQDQKISIQDLHVEMKALESESSSILWEYVKNLNVTRWEKFPLPRLIFQAESLKGMYLTGLELIDPEKVLFKHLKTLHLKDCYIEDEIFAKLISSCPLIKYLVLDSCKGLKTIKLDKARNLTRFDFTPNFYHEDKNISFLNNHFPHLKSLHLGHMRLSAESFGNLFSNNNFPCLEELELDSCRGFEEFVLSSGSIKRLIIKKMSCRGTIDAPNILYFKVSNTCGRPPSISLTTTSREWKSHINVCNGFSHTADVASWFLKINELLKALSQSRIYFEPSFHYSFSDCGHFMGEPTVVEHLDLSRCEYYSAFSYPADILICFFSICRPRYIIGLCSSVHVETEPCSCCGELTSCKTKIILKKRGHQTWFWQQDLEEIRSEVWDHNAKEWHHVRLGTLSSSTLPALSDKKHIRYRLKWIGEKTG